MKPNAISKRHATNEFYHVYSRGVEKKNIFLTNRDKIRFQKMLYIFNSSKQLKFRDVAGLDLEEIDRGEILVNIGAYCLMDNHFHLLLSENVPGGISKFMQKLMTSYSKYFNLVNKKTGRLFESNYKSKWCDNDEYLKYLFCYIPLNPLKQLIPNWKTEGIKDLKTAKKFLSDYSFSSYFDHVDGGREEGLILNSNAFPEYFSGKYNFNRFIDDWMKFAIDDTISLV
jgi:putative transposase